MKKLTGKSLLILVALLVVMFLLSLNVVASETEMRLYVDGERQIFAQGMGTPFIEGGRTFVPIRFVAESTGGKVDFDADTNGIEIVREDRTVKMTISKTNYTVNGAKQVMDATPFLKASENRTYTPFRFIAEGLGLKVEFQVISGESVVFTFGADKTDAEIQAMINKIKIDIAKEVALLKPAAGLLPVKATGIANTKVIEKEVTGLLKDISDGITASLPDMGIEVKETPSFNGGSFLKLGDDVYFAHRGQGDIQLSFTKQRDPAANEVYNATLNYFFRANAKQVRDAIGTPTLPMKPFKEIKVDNMTVGIDWHNLNEIHLFVEGWKP